MLWKALSWGATVVPESVTGPWIAAGRLPPAGVERTPPPSLFQSGDESEGLAREAESGLALDDFRLPVESSLLERKEPRGAPVRVSRLPARLRFRLPDRVGWGSGGSVT